MASPSMLPRLRAITAAAVLLTGGVALTACSGAVRDDSGAVTEGGIGSPLYLRVGDCLDSGDPGTVQSVPLVPCDEPHDDEVFHAFDLEDGDYPESEVMDAAVEDTCTPEFEEFIGMSYWDSALDWYSMTPTRDGWNDGDHEVLCMAFDPDARTTGSLKGAAR